MENKRNGNNSSQNHFEAIIYEHKARQSFKSLMVKLYLRFKNTKPSMAKAVLLKQQNPGYKDKDECQEPPKELFDEFEVTSWKVKGRNVYRFTPKENPTQKHVLFLHGGAYIYYPLKYHWEFVQKLVRNYHCTVIFPDYPLAPEHTYVDTFAMVDLIYKQLVNEVDQNDLIIMGDSAGGGLSLALAQKMKNENVRQPGQIILISPWLDITCSNPQIPEVDKYDPMLQVEGGISAGRAYAGDTDPNNYLLSPINGVLEGLGQISVFIGTHDLLFPDAIKFRNMCDQKGIRINFFVYPKMIHIWVIFGLPESEKAIEQIGHLINDTR